MIKVVPADRRHFTDFGWLKTFWLFSFGTYYDPENIRFGPLRVFNDDVVEPGTGFPTHPHEEMEIITIVLEGEITHADSMGNKTVIGAGDVQRMTAGTGLTHSEYNLGDEPVHFHQVWVLPDTPGLEPGYAQKHFAPESWRNRLHPVASGRGVPDTVAFHADATLHLASLDPGVELRPEGLDQRRVFLYMISGEMEIGGQRLEAGDQARIDCEPNLALKAAGASSLILIDLPSCRGLGYGADTLAGDRKR